MDLCLLTSDRCGFIEILFAEFVVGDGQAFEHLLEKELIVFADGRGQGEALEFRPVQLLLDNNELHEGLNNNPVCPVLTHLLFPYWHAGQIWSGRLLDSSFLFWQIVGYTFYVQHAAITKMKQSLSYSFFKQ